jgi:hypothetical protein
MGFYAFLALLNIGTSPVKRTRQGTFVGEQKCLFIRTFWVYPPLVFRLSFKPLINTPYIPVLILW